MKAWLTRSEELFSQSNLSEAVEIADEKRRSVSELLRMSPDIWRTCFVL
jgi:hypothetical protein